MKQILLSIASSLLVLSLCLFPFAVATAAAPDALLLEGRGRQIFFHRMIVTTTALRADTPA